MASVSTNDPETVMRPAAAFVLALGVATTLCFGCRREAARPTSKDYRLMGTVREIKKDAGQVVIHHEEIPGFMPAMTMPFSVKDRGLFEDLAVGDEVEGTLRVASEGAEVKDYELLDLAVRKPALATSPAPSLRLSVAGGAPQLSVVPKPLEPGETVPDFTMTTEDGTSVKLSDLRGDVVVLTFIYTRCPLPDFCPLMDRKFAALASAVGSIPERARHVRLISLSFDPEHDTPEVLKAHARTQGAHPPLWTFAVASHDELARVAPALGLSYGPTATEIIHNLSTAVIDRQGKLASLRVGTAAKSWDTAELLKVISPLVSDSTTSTTP